MNNISSRPIDSAIVATLACAAMLAACGKTVDSATSAQSDDPIVAFAEPGREGAGNYMQKKNANAAITASVRAELARDPDLGKLRIGVDADNGQVSLRGYVPDASTRDRATQLASAVEGVSNVDNRLVVSQ